MTPVAILGMAVAVAAPLPKERVKPMPSVVGEWVVERSTFAGEEQPRDGEVVYVFREDGTYALFRNARLFVDGRRYTTDSKAVPATIDLFTPGTSAEPLYRGIYKVDTLTICHSDRGGPRPTKFESTSHSATNLKVFQRVKRE
jgi:uncharacterized protein (TIGR03067 family)